MTKISLLFLFATITIFSPTNSLAQPSTEIYLFDLTSKKGQVTISNPVNISNHIGYDNQPFFHPSLPVLYYVSAQDSGKTDIIEYNYTTNSRRNFTTTVENEYSPQVTPDGKFISCILQRANGEQNLVKYPISRGEAVVLINNLTVGYHAWLDNTIAGVFTLPRPFALHLVNFSTKKDSIIAHNIGRSLHKIPGEDAVSYLQKIDATNWEIKKFTGAQSLTIVKSVVSTEHDMTWAGEGKILMSSERKIFFCDEKNPQEWKEINIQSPFSINTITRLAVNATGNKIAIVVNE